MSKKSSLHDVVAQLLIGRQVGAWVVVGLSDELDPDRRPILRCRCVCGVVRDVVQKEILRGTSKSCGCLKALFARLTRHRKTAPRPSFIAPTSLCLKERKAWNDLRSRCSNPKNRNYPNYGGRGITVCERWSESFDNFFADMGTAPTPAHSLDRIDNDKGYSPENCRWASWREQARNKRGVLRVEYNGLNLPLSEWQDLTGVEAGVIRSRIQLGWSPLKALTTRPLAKGVKTRHGSMEPQKRVRKKVRKVYPAGAPAFLTLKEARRWPPVPLLHKPSGQARVRWRTVDYYLGLWGSAEARAQYTVLLTRLATSPAASMATPDKMLPSG